MIARLDDAARDDIHEATAWYAARDAKAAIRFVAAVDAAITEITEFPGGPPRLEAWTGDEDIRRVILHRFPFVVVYEVLAEEIVIWCMTHTSRRPNHWQNRRRAD